jgi:hypothetical protein
MCLSSRQFVAPENRRKSILIMTLYRIDGIATAEKVTLLSIDMTSFRVNRILLASSLTVKRHSNIIPKKISSRAQESSSSAFYEMIHNPFAPLFFSESPNSAPGLAESSCSLFRTSPRWNE